MTNTDAGIRIKTHRGRGGLLQNVVYENLTMNAVKNPIYIMDYYPERNAPKDPPPRSRKLSPHLRPPSKDITIRNVTATNCPTAGIIRGLPEMPVANITLSNVVISATNGMKIYQAKGIQFIDSKVTVQKGPTVTTFNAEVTGIETTDFKP